MTTTDRTGTLVERIVKIIKAQGPMTRHQLFDALDDVPPLTVHSAIQRMRCPTTRRKQLLHIHGWVRCTEGKRHDMMAIFNVGERKDAKKPPPMSWAERHRRSRANKKKRLQTIRQASVFTMGLS